MNSRKNRWEALYGTWHFDSDHFDTWCSLWSEKKAKDTRFILWDFIYSGCFYVDLLLSPSLLMIGATHYSIWSRNSIYGRIERRFVSEHFFELTVPVDTFSWKSIDTPKTHVASRYSTGSRSFVFWVNGVHISSLPVSR